MVRIQTQQPQKHLNLKCFTFSSFPVYPVTCYYVNDLTEGSSPDLRLATALNPFLILFMLSFSDKGADDMHLVSLIQIK